MQLELAAGSVASHHPFITTLSRHTPSSSPHLLTLYTWGDKGLLIVITNIKSDTSLQGVTPALYIAHP